MRRRKGVELLWEARVVIVWMVPEQLRMLVCPFTEADDESEMISVGGPLSIVGGESEGVRFEEAVGRAGLISETETALDTAGLPIC